MTPRVPIHPHTLSALEWLSHNLAFSFGIGFFYGIFVIDVVYSGHVMNYISEFDDKNKIVIRLESLKKIYMRASSIADLAFSFL